ncbi:MAG: hypothetical protein QOF51_2650 [Chloroflexota bacterium]|jgi:hypothetical protein|nr:hypothetical protein [Chloroflexota bacterium]
MTVDVLSPELQFIIGCIQRALGRPTEPIADLALDWDRFVAEACNHGLAPMVHAGLASLNTPFPSEARAALRARAIRDTVHHAALFEPALRSTLGVLGEAGLHPIALKGSALAYLAYPKPTYRTLSDIDLLVPFDRLDQAADCLIRNGYQRYEQSLPDGHQHLPPFITPDGRFVIELHHHVLAEANPYVLDMRGFWARSQQRELAGVQATVLAPTDILLHVCIHLAFGHRYAFFPLRTFVDILAMTDCAREPLDWDLLLDTVQQTRTAGAVYWPLRLSQDWFGATIPPFVLDRLAPSRITRGLMERVIESPYIVNERAPEELGTSVLYRLVREFSLYSGCSVLAQMGALWRGLFPQPEDITHLPEEMTQSRLRYSAHWWNLPRLARGATAFGRLITGRQKQAEAPPVVPTVTTATPSLSIVTPVSSDVHPAPAAVTADS